MSLRVVSGREEGQDFGSRKGRWDLRRVEWGGRPREKLCSGDELNILLIVFCLFDLFHCIKPQ